jgi:hypothetical protein
MRSTSKRKNGRHLAAVRLLVAGARNRDMYDLGSIRIYLST